MIDAIASVPLAQADIEWNTPLIAGAYRVAEVLVIDRGDREARNVARAERRTSSYGACCAGWATGDDPRVTPEGVHSQMVRMGFASDDEVLNALEQFSRIEGLEWAVVMASALRMRLAVERGDTDQ